MEARSCMIFLQLFFLFFTGVSNLQGSSARIGRIGETELSNLEFESLLQDLIDRRFYIGVSVLQYGARSELVHGITLLIPIDASMVRTSAIQHHYRGLVRFHILETNLNFRALKLLPVGTWLPTELVGYGVEVTHNSDTIFALNHVPIVEPDVCPSLAQLGITCHGVNGVLDPLSTLSPKPYSSSRTPSASSPPPISSPSPSPSPSPSQMLLPISPTVATTSSNGVLSPNQTSPSPNIPPVFQSPVTNPTPPFGIPPLLLAPTSLDNSAVPVMIAGIHIYTLYILVGFFLVQMM